jgi:phosphohistidine phosphatase
MTKPPGTNSLKRLSRVNASAAGAVNSAVSSATRLLLVRHGRAETGTQGPDSERRLIAAGISELEASCRALARLDLRPARLLSSPYIRTRQTSEILGLHLGPTLAVQACDSLAAGATPEAMLAEIHQVVGSLAVVVGHMPDLAALLARLLGSEGTSFEPGGMALVEFEGAPAFNKGRLVWALSPRQLREIAAGGALP